MIEKIAIVIFSLICIVLGWVAHEVYHRFREEK